MFKQYIALIIKKAACEMFFFNMNKCNNVKLNNVKVNIFLYVS